MMITLLMKRRCLMPSCDDADDDDGNDAMKE